MAWQVKPDAAMGSEIIKRRANSDDERRGINPEIPQGLWIFLALFGSESLTTCSFRTAQLALIKFFWNARGLHTLGRIFYSFL